VVARNVWRSTDEEEEKSKVNLWDLNEERKDISGIAQEDEEEKKSEEGVKGSGEDLQGVWKEGGGGEERGRGGERGETSLPGLSLTKGTRNETLELIDLPTSQLSYRRLDDEVQTL